MTKPQPTAQMIMVNVDELNQLKAAATLVARRVELANNSTLTPVMRAQKASNLRDDELAYGLRFLRHNMSLSA